jgi:hypothetical protein
MKKLFLALVLSIELLGFGLNNMMSPTHPLNPTNPVSPTNPNGIFYDDSNDTTKKRDSRIPYETKMRSFYVFLGFIFIVIILAVLTVIRA